MQKPKLHFDLGKDLLIFFSVRNTFLTIVFVLYYNVYYSETSPIDLRLFSNDL